MAVSNVATWAIEYRLMEKHGIRIDGHHTNNAGDGKTALDGMFAVVNSDIRLTCEENGFDADTAETVPCGWKARRSDTSLFPATHVPKTGLTRQKQTPYQ